MNGDQRPDDITFWRYDDPIHDAQLIPGDPGVTSGRIIVWDGRPGDAWQIPVALLTAPDGSQAIEQTGDVAPVTILDDTA